MIHPCPTCRNKVVHNPTKKEKVGSAIKDFRLYKTCGFCKVIYKAYDE